MSIQYGNARRIETDQGVAFKGKLNVPNMLAGTIALVPIETRTPESPTHAVKILQNEEWAELGKAWTKKLTAGGDFLTLSIDGPTFDKPLNLSLFPEDDDQQPSDWDKSEDDPVNWKFVWQRPRKAKSVPKKTGGEALNLDDEIPFD